MSATTFAMSGMISLGEVETGILESLDLTVPAVLTTAELKLLVKEARARLALDYHEVITPLMTEALNSIEDLAVE